MLKLGIGYGGVNYASSKTSPSANAASADLIDTLAEGAIGIYGISASGMTLITTTSGLSAYSEFMIVQGGKDAGELIHIATFKPSELISLNGSTYTRATYQFAYVGYNGETGALNNPTTVVGDSASVGLKVAQTSNNPINPDVLTYDTGKLAASASGYAILSPIANNCNLTASALRIGKAFVTAAGSTADFTGTAVAMKFTKGSKTVSFVDAALAASTGSVNKGDIIAIPSIGGRSFTFTAGADGHTITIGETTYNVPDAGNAGANATAIAAAINAGSQATASVNSSTVTITYNENVLLPAPLVYDVVGLAYIAVTIATGDDMPALIKAANTVSAAASFELEYAWVGETCYAKGGTTEATDCGIYTVSGEYGLKIIGETLGKNVQVSADGVLSNAQVTYGTSLAGVFTNVGASVGINTNALISDLESYGMYWRGAVDLSSVPNKSPKTKYVRSGKTYDAYTLQIRNSYNAPFGTSNKIGHNISTVVVAFERTSPSTNGTSGYNQRSFEDYITAIAALNPTCAVSNADLV